MINKKMSKNIEYISQFGFVRFPIQSFAILIST